MSLPDWIKDYPTSPITPSKDDSTTQALKIARAMRSGPPQITADAAIVDMNPDMTISILRLPQNGSTWTCMPGNENIIGNNGMCADVAGMQWGTSIARGLDKPTNVVPGLVYMLNGAVQHSNTNPKDTTSPGIPIGPHMMIIYPVQSPITTAHTGLPKNVRDAGAWVMFDGTPFAYLHICGYPWSGNVYDSTKNQPVWNMQYLPPVTQ